MINQTPAKIGKTVRLCGWVNSRRDHGKVGFIDLRDRTGIVQVVLTDALVNTASLVRDEFVLAIEGVVAKRPDNMINPDLATGEIEIQASQIEILAESKTPPFDLSGDGYSISEQVRLEYRYLDLRRPRMAKNLRLRHKVVKYVRNFLDDRDFVEIETPYISKATPEGARDFLVPSRLQPGSFYALPQSPQQYKQMLMVAGFEKYYQLARCFRDEDPRADRAYGEFTQLDLEMSFTNREEILSLIEELMTELTEKVVGKEVLYKPFPRISYQEAMEFFGDDKFDLCDYELSDGKWLKKPNPRSEKVSNSMAFAWVLDFPLFEQTETREIRPSHHPFTAPKDEDIPLLDSDPFKVRSWQYDLVCNGYEVAGGSIRITNPALQAKIFGILGHSEQELQQKFGHLLKAFEYGVPPHGGIASGIDRLMAIFANEPNLREVIAYPMTSGGRMAVMGMPSKADDAQLKELSLSVDAKDP